MKTLSYHRPFDPPLPELEQVYFVELHRHITDEVEHEITLVADSPSERTAMLTVLKAALAQACYSMIPLPIGWPISRRMVPAHLHCPRLLHAYVELLRAVTVRRALNTYVPDYGRQANEVWHELHDLEVLAIDIVREHPTLADKFPVAARVLGICSPEEAAYEREMMAEGADVRVQAEHVADRRTPPPPPPVKPSGGELRLECDVVADAIEADAIAASMRSASRSVPSPLPSLSFYDVL